MNEALVLMGRLLGGLGALTCVAALIVRLGGNFTVVGFEVGTLFAGGVASMVAGCLCLLVHLTAKH